MNCAKTAVPIEMQFGMLIWVGSGNRWWLGLVVVRWS